jgi:membrane protease YdiL (CAAX protease family)
MSEHDAAAPQPAIDAHSELRHPLTVLICILPLSIIGELYRWIILRRHELLADEIWQELGDETGIFSPVIPAVLILIGCLAWMFIAKKEWKLPSLGIITQVVAWSFVWALVRTVVSFTNTGVQTDSVSFLGTIGLCMSGAVQEEIIFRGILIGFIAYALSFTGIKFKWALWICLPISATLFALAHTHIMNKSLDPSSWHPAMVIEHIIAGLIYGYAFIRQGLAVATLSHFLFNLLVISGILSGL